MRLLLIFLWGFWGFQPQKWGILQLLKHNTGTVVFWTRVLSVVQKRYSQAGFYQVTQFYNISSVKLLFLPQKENTIKQLYFINDFAVIFRKILGCYMLKKFTCYCCYFLYYWWKMLENNQILESKNSQFL